MFGRPKTLLTGKMEHDAGMEAMKRVKDGASIEKVASRYRRSPGFIEGMVAHYEADLPSFLNPYMERRRCSETRAADIEARKHPLSYWYRRLAGELAAAALRRGWIS